MIFSSKVHIQVFKYGKKLKYQNLDPIKSFKCQLVNQILTLFGPDLLCKLTLMIYIGGSQLNKKNLYKHMHICKH